MNVRWVVPVIALAASTATLAAAQTTTAPAPGARTAVAAAPAAAPSDVATFGQAPPVPPTPPAPPAPAAAAAPQAPAAPRSPQAPRPARATTGEAPAPAEARHVRGQLLNLRLEFTVMDQIGTAAPVRKTVMMNVADGESGRIRTNAEVPRNKAWTTVPLSVDAYPTIEGTKIRLRASLEYQLLSEAPGPDLPAGKTSMTQSVTALLNDGVSTILCQSADPLTDRKVTLEVKATIIR
ncbi:MAG: hypothetical protein R6V57_15920 [Vicinamibacterales bacterium]